MRCCEGESGERVLFQLFFIPLNQSYFVCYQLSFDIQAHHTHTRTHHRPVQMIPEGGEPSSTITSSNKTDDVMLAGYRECAMEALNWLLGLGYEPGHPLIRSLSAHLTKKQAYLEKLNLERYLIDETYRMSEDEFDKNTELDCDTADARYEICAYQVQNNKEIQKALVDAVFKGCNLQYSHQNHP